MTSVLDASVGLKWVLPEVGIARGNHCVHHRRLSVR